MRALIAIMLALGIFATAQNARAEPPPPFTVSLSGDVKPLTWHLQNSVAGKVVPW